MADIDSLYGVSVSPPPRHSGLGRMDHNNQKQLNSTTPKATSSKITHASASMRTFVPTTKPLPFAAPTAKMIATPPKDQSGTIRTPTSTRSNKGKGRALDQSAPVLRSDILKRTAKSKEAVDFQAEADAIEAARDRADPDFRVPQDSDEILVSKKRRTNSQSQHPSPAKKAKQPRKRNFLYMNCRQPTKQTRDNHIARIRENWGDTPDRWIAESIMPTKTNKVAGKRSGTMLLRNPRDWNGNLLAELSYLSSLKRPEEAFKLLRRAVNERSRGGGGAELLPTDVQRVIRRVRRSPAAPTTAPPATPPPDVGAETANDETEQLITETAAAREQSPPAPQLPSPRSPTFGREANIKQEYRAAALDRPSNGGEGGWNGYDAEQEKYEELDLQWKVEQASFAAARAEYARFQQRKRLRENARLHGNDRQDAIIINAREDDE